jgi:hypothetical protein
VDLRDRKSILGFVFLVNRGTIAYYSKKIASIARSTIEAEFVGISEAIKVTLCIR